MNRIAGYHFGWLDQDGAPTLGRSGKYLRAALALITTGACGIGEGIGIRAASAVELVHNFSLLHDDIMDADEMRRGRSTAWAVFGTPLALLTGDGLLAAAYGEIMEATHDATHAVAAYRLLAGTVESLILGQAMDLDFETRGTSVEPAECGTMHRGKTGALLSCACALGAAAGGEEAGRVETLGQFGMHLGQSFQISDDILGIWGNPEVTGKPLWNDLRRQKKTFPVVAALAAGGHNSAELAQLMVHPDWHLDGEKLARSVHLIEEAGGLEAAEAEAQRNYNKCLAILDSLSFEGVAREQLLQIVEFAVNRKF
ncbi:polyprenyl synthetase family protein [Streptomyces sp. NPDC002952]|uniref:polyprenyl synthetase family protein n=1 Tax=Streptomyces sp. NPDC002952 TaxID=3364673 RepID=UPI0036C252FE